MKININATYKHYKGNLCKVIALAKHSATLEDMVVYEALYPNPLSRVWIRPYSEWTEEVTNKDGAKVPRYTLSD